MEMPFCEYCGIPIKEKEICNCRNNESTPNTHGSDTPVYSISRDTTQKKTGGFWWIWLIIIPSILFIFFIIAFLASIFIPFFIGYNKKAKISSVNDDASSIYRAVNCALVEFDGHDYNTNGYYIISSNESYNWNIPKTKFDIDKFYVFIDNYYDDSDNTEWFVIIENGCATYSATSESWSDEFVGTYPYSATVNGPVLYGSNTSSSVNYTLSQLYREASLYI